MSDEETLYVGTKFSCRCLHSDRNCEAVNRMDCGIREANEGERLNNPRCSKCMGNAVTTGKREGPHEYQQLAKKMSKEMGYR